MGEHVVVIFARANRSTRTSAPSTDPVVANFPQLPRPLVEAALGRAGAGQGLPEAITK